jgi:hypothetical protein
MTECDPTPFYAPGYTTAPKQPRVGEHLWTLCCGRSYVAPPLEGQRRGLTVHGSNIIAAAFARSADSLGTPQEGHESWLLRSISSGRM